MIKALRKKLLDMDLHELDTETQYFREYMQLIQRQHEQYNQRLFELSGPKKVEIFQKDKRDDPKEAERLREKQEMQLRLKLRQLRLESLQQARQEISQTMLQAGVVEQGGGGQGGTPATTTPISPTQQSQPLQIAAGGNAEAALPSQ